MLGESRIQWAFGGWIVDRVGDHLGTLLLGIIQAILASSTQNLEPTPED
jgi:hypothetical protein